MSVAKPTVLALFLAYLEHAGSSATNAEFDALVRKELPGRKWSMRHWHQYRTKIRRGDFDHRLPAGLKKLVTDSRSIPVPGLKNVTPRNPLPEVEKTLAECLSAVVHFLSPKIATEIAARNVAWAKELKQDFPNAFDHSACFFKGSASVFGPVRRKETKSERTLASQKFHASSKAVLDLNWFPREAVTFICTGSRYTSERWKSSGLSEFELAHILPHKEAEAASVRYCFKQTPTLPYPIGLFTCVANVALIPKGMAKPTDVGGHVRLAFFRKYFELYGEMHSAGFSGLKIPEGAEWINTLKWRNDCVIEPTDWAARVERLDSFRRRRLRSLLGGKIDPECEEAIEEGENSEDSGN